MKKKEAPKPCNHRGSGVQRSSVRITIFRPRPARTETLWTCCELKAEAWLRSRRKRG
jgi:hypothetical protein